MDAQIPFEVANRAVEHLGRSLYGTTPPALAEIVANSYDAYATDVEVLHFDADDDMDECVVIADNGIGMSDECLKRQYSKIGREKSPVPIPDGMERRKPMGRKGIGKLAAFSIGGTYEVYTRCDSEESWRHFSLSYERLRDAPSPYLVDMEEINLPNYLARFGGQRSGCIVVIRELKRKWMRNTESGLKSRVSRRFYLTSKDVDFHLSINGEPVDLSRNDYYNEMDLVMFFGYKEVETLFGPSEERSDVSLKSIGSLSESESDLLSRMLNEHGAKGWLGFVRKPKDLHKNKDENFSNIVVYINGKIADDDLLKNNPDSTFASKYIVGEIVADYLGELDGSEEVVTSSRQGLDNDDPRVGELLRFVAMARSKAITLWNERRKKRGASDLPTYIKEDEGYQHWMSGLSTDETAFNNGIVRCVKTLVDSGLTDERDEEDAVKSLINGSIEMVELARRSRLVSRIGADIDRANAESAIAGILRLLASINVSEAYSARDVITDRMKAIEKLERLMQDHGSIERKFQELLGENPWIINPAWQALGVGVDDSFSVSREVFRKLYDKRSDEERRNFIDIFVTMREAGRDRCAIVELKRNAVTSYSKVEYIDIYSQIKRYRDAVIQNDPDRGIIRGTDIPAYFIIPSDSGPSGNGHKIEYTDDDYVSFAAAKIEVIPYDKLLIECKRTYAFELNALGKSDLKPHFAPSEISNREDVQDDS